MGDLPLLGTNAQIIRITEALFGVRPGNTYFTSFQAYTEDNGIDALSNALVGALAPADSAALATTVVSHYQVPADLQTEDGQNVVELLELFITAQLNTVSEAEWGAKVLEITELYSTLSSDPLLGDSVSAFNQTVVESLVYSANPENPDIYDPANPPVEPEVPVDLSLTTDQDNLVGTDADDVFEGIVFDNSNTLQSGDRLDGGAGEDTLNAEIGLSQAFAISAKTTSVERIFINARSDSNDSNDNNLQNDFVQIDAGDMEGVTEWGTNGSRADVVIEDIRIQDDEVTSDITFSMRDTDPGSNADGDDGAIANDTQAGASLHAYFDANSLRSTTSTSAPVLEIQVLDIQNALYDDGGTNPTSDPEPLKDDTNDGFTFTLERPDGSTKDFSVSNPDISAANTYGELRDAVEAAFVDAGINAIVTKSDNLFSGTHKTTGDTAFGNPIHVELVDEEGQVIAGEWTVGSTSQDANVNIAADIVPLIASERTDLLVSADLILDNVGRGSEGGDAEIGTMSTRGGVEQLDIKVEDTSWLTNVRSTNNALEVVTVVESDVARDAVTADGVISAGNLTLGSGMDWWNNDLIEYRVAPTHVATNGLVDVRVFNASTFGQELKIGASLTHAAIEKYLQIPSVEANPGVVTGDTDLEGSENDDTVDAIYNLGSNDDYLNMLLESDLTADSDFTLTLKGNGGDDSIRTMIDTMNHTTVPGVLPTWQEAQSELDNLLIDAGAGHDTVETLGAGDFIINTQSGEDAVYADNTGALPGEDAVANVREIQIITFTDPDQDGDLSVGGVKFGILAADNEIAVAGKAKVALDASTLAITTVDNGDGTITITWDDFGNQDPIEVIDLGAPTGVEVDDVAEVTVSAIIPQQQVQTITFSGATATGTVDLTDDVTTGIDAAAPKFNGGLGATISVPVVNGDPDTVVAQAVVDFLNDPANADPALESVVLGADGISVVFTWVDEGIANDINVTTLGDADGVSFLNQNGVNAVSEEQEFVFAAGAPGVIVVDGVEVTLDAVTAADPALTAAAVVAALTTGGIPDNALYSDIVTDGVDTVTFTFDDTEDHDLVSYVDQGILTSGLPVPAEDAVVTDTDGSIAGAFMPNIVSSDIFGLDGDMAVWTANNLDDDNQISTLGESEIVSFDGIKGQLQVDFKDITSEVIDIQYTGNATSTLQIRQALKEAINTDPELSKLLVVKDGPNDTFVVESLIDGFMAESDFEIDFIAPLEVGDAAIEGRLQLTDGQEGFNDLGEADAAYDESFGLNDYGFELTGADSTSISDNTINLGTGEHDVAVLGTTDDGVAEVTSSNDTVVFTDEDFGHDTIVHFELDTDAGFGGDQLDFTAYLDADVSVFDDGDDILDDNEIITDSTISASVAAVEAAYDTVADNAAQGVVLVEDDDDENVFHAYAVESTSSSTDVDATYIGTVDMADTLDVVGVDGFTAPDFV